MSDLIPPFIVLSAILVMALRLGNQHLSIPSRAWRRPAIALTRLLAAGLGRIFSRPRRY